MISDYLQFILEGKIASFTKNIQIEFDIEGEEHFFDRLSRSDNDPDEFGVTIIDENEGNR